MIRGHGRNSHSAPSPVDTHAWSGLSPGEDPFFPTGSSSSTGDTRCSVKMDGRGGDTSASHMIGALLRKSG